MIAGCSPQDMAQAATATASAAQQAASPTVQTTPTANSSTAATGTPEVSGPAPTPTGAPPADPLTLLNVFKYLISPQVVVKRDMLQLDKDSVPEALITVSEPSDVITQETNTVLQVLDYDPAYREWNIPWDSDIITGTASPLPGANRADGLNGGDLLRTGDPILMARTTTRDGRAHLYMWRWDTQAARGVGVPIKMLPKEGAPEQQAFDADLDVKVADLDNDGVYEVVADNVSGVVVWKWDGTRYAPWTPEVKR